MGTSLEMIDKTYGHLLPDAVDYERGLLDAFDTREASGQLSDTGEGLVYAKPLQIALRVRATNLRS
jgi:hypothetical protein